MNGPHYGRDPFEVALVVVCLAVGVAGLVLPDPPSRNFATVFGGAAVLVYLGFLVASTIALIGIFWPRDTVRRLQVGMLIERASMYPIAGLAGAYSISAVAEGGWAALVATLLVGGIAIACIARSRQISAALISVAQQLPPEE